jgi:hypothetical protein
LAKDLDKEIQKLGQDLQNLNFDNLEKAIGKSGTDAFRAQALDTKIQADKNFLAGTGLEISSAQARIKAGTVTGPLIGTNYSRDAQAAKIDLASAERQQSMLMELLAKDQAEQEKLLQGGLEHQQEIRDAAAQEAEDKAQKASDRLTEQRKRAQGVAGMN